MKNMETGAEVGSTHKDGHAVRNGMFLVLIILFVLNATVTIGHFISMFAGHMTTRNSLDVVLRIAIPDIAIAAIPSFLAAWGMWRLRRWGIWLAVFIAGAYFHGQVQLLVMAFQKDLGVLMAAISVYFIAFSGFFSIYLWRRKEHFA